MYPHRAKEISESALLAKVLYNGVPVFIQHVNEKNETAQLIPLMILARKKQFLYQAYKKNRRSYPISSWCSRYLLAH